MAQRNIDYGAYPDDGNANSIRDAFIATQDNFTELFNQPQAGVSQLVGGAGITLYNASGVAQAQLAGNVNVSANIYKITFQAGDPANPASLGAQFLTFNGNTTATIDSSNPGTIPDVVLDISPGFLANFQVANLFVSNKAIIGSNTVVYSNLQPVLTVAGSNTANNIPTGNIVTDHLKTTPLGRVVGNVSLQDAPYTNVGGIIYNNYSTVPYLASQGIQVLSSNPDFFRYDTGNFNLLVPNISTNNITVSGNINGNFTGNISGNVTVAGLDRGLAIKSGSGLTTALSTGNSVSTTIASNASSGATIINITSVAGISVGQSVSSSISNLIASGTLVSNVWGSNNNVELDSPITNNATISDPITFTTLVGFLRYTTSGVFQAVTTTVSYIGSNVIISAGAGLTLSNTASNLLILNNVSSFNTSTGALRVNGGAGISQALNVGANINANSLNIGNGAPTGNLGAFRVVANGEVATTSTAPVNTGSELSSGALRVAGGVSVGNNLYVGSLTNSSNSISGALRVVGGTGIGDNLFVGNGISGTTLKIGGNASQGGVANFAVSSTGVLTVSATNSGNVSNANYSIVTSGGILANSDLRVSGVTNSIDTTTGALIVAGGAGISGNLNVGGRFVSSDQVAFTSLTDSLDSSNGAVTVSGGVGIAKKLNVGTSITTDAIYVGNNSGNSGFVNGILSIQSNGNILTTSLNTVIFPTNASNLGIGLQANTMTLGAPSSLLLLNSSTIAANGQTTQNIFETDVATLNFVGSATSVFIGANSGTVTLRNPTLVGTQSTQNVYNTTASTVNAFGAATLLNLGQNSGIATLRNPTLVGTETSQNVYNSTATTVNAFGTATSLNMGSSSGTATLRNPTLVGTETSQNVYNTTATTVNAFGEATAINMGNLNSTLTLRSSTVVGAAGQINQNLFNTVATTVNAFGAASTVNFASNVDPTINIGNGGSAGSVKIYSTLNASSNTYTNGALQVSGGAGFAKDVYIGGNLYLVGSNSNGTVSNTKIEIQNTSDSANATDTSASISTTGGVSIAKSLNVGANIRANYLGVGGNSGFNGSGETISFSGNSSVSNIDSTAATLNVANSTVGTINFGSAASNINIGVDSVGSRLTIRNGNVIGANSTQLLYDGVATTMNFARAATSITMGAVTGTMTLQNPTVVGTQATQNLHNTVASTMNFAGQASSLNMGLNSGTATLRNPTLVGTETTQNVYNSTATTVNAFGAATSLNVGSTSGTMTINNPTVVGTQTTQNVYNSTATTVNAFGAATSLNVGSTSGTMTINNPTVVGTQATQNLFNSTATTINFGGAASTILVGASGGVANFAGTINVVGNVNGNNIAGIIRPTGGNGTAGIIFPADPGGGSGDLATIKYYAYSGEATVLELAVTNDNDDIIKLNASGGTEIIGTATIGNVAATNVNVSSTLTTTNITTGSSSTAGNITGNWTLTAGSRLAATYADLAEYYSADAPIEKGRVVEIGGTEEITMCNTFMSTRVAGVVTTEPAYVMNSMNNYVYPVCVALVGRIPVKVRGKIKKGDMLVSSINGCAIATSNPVLGSIIGKALQDYDSTEEGTIQVMIGRN